MLGIMLLLLCLSTCLSVLSFSSDENFGCYMRLVRHFFIGLENQLTEQQKCLYNFPRFLDGASGFVVAPIKFKPQLVLLPVRFWQEETSYQYLTLFTPKIQNHKPVLQNRKKHYNFFFLFKFDSYLTAEIIHMKEHHRKGRKWWGKSEGN